MTRSEMLDKIDRMPIYEKDYKVIESLINVDDRFFVKVMEEILEGNLFFSDFDRIFKDESYASILSRNLEAQDKLRTEIFRLAEFRRQILNDPGYSIDLKTINIGVTKTDPGDPLNEFYSYERNMAVDNQIYQLLDTISSDNPELVAVKLRIFKALELGQISKEDFLLFAKDYIVPISEEGQVLDRSDVNFMVENGLTEDQMKKLKALSKFIRRKDSL
jgi:hypothetical protein